MLDTFHDRRNGYRVLHESARRPHRLSEADEGNSNADWNPVWEVRTGRFEGGWTIEMAIPFKSIRYVSGADQVWGIQMRRADPAQERVGAPDAAAAGHGRAAGVLPHLAGGHARRPRSAAGRARNIELKPYAHRAS